MKNRHPKELIDVWIGDLVDAFERSIAQYERPLDRGGPREEALRTALRLFLPQKYGVASGHVVSSHPAWSRQADVLIYNALESPVFAHDEGHQGTVVPAEGVYGVVEVKSTLDQKEFIAAVANIAEFKKLCGRIDAPPLGVRYGGIFAYAIPGVTEEEQRQLFNAYVEAARAVIPEWRPDHIFVLGTRSHPGRHLAMLMRQDSPRGPLDYSLITDPERAFRTFLLGLYGQLGWIRTGPPAEIVHYLFDPRSEIETEEADARFKRESGLAPLKDAVAVALGERFPRQPQCSMCGGSEFGLYDDLYCLVATKDIVFGRLNAPRVPVTLLECGQCRHISLFGTNGLGVTVPLDHVD